MAANPGDQAIAAHVKSVSTRAKTDTDRLISAMLRSCWPGGTGDRTESGALDWVRRWGPRGVGALPPVCDCHAGRCRVCN